MFNLGYLSLPQVVRQTDLIKFGTIQPPCRQTKIAIKWRLKRRQNNYAFLGSKDVKFHCHKSS